MQQPTKYKRETSSNRNFKFKTKYTADITSKIPHPVALTWTYEHDRNNYMGE